jgi:hypothetical protein
MIPLMRGVAAAGKEDWFRWVVDKIAIFRHQPDNLRSAQGRVRMVTNFPLPAVQDGQLKHAHP